MAGMTMGWAAHDTITGEVMDAESTLESARDACLFAWSVTYGASPEHAGWRALPTPVGVPPGGRVPGGEVLVVAGFATEFVVRPFRGRRPRPGGWGRAAA